jgi:hypothetical protein
MKTDHNCYIVVRIPLLASVPDTLIADEEAMTGMCTILKEMLAESIRNAGSPEDQIFQIDGINISYHLRGKG